MTPDDEKFLRRAIELADRAGAAGERPFGSLLVGPAGEVLVEDHNTMVSEADITAHPELKLARWAARELAPEVAAGTTMYTSCQPCPMCATAIDRSGLGRVVYALSSEQFESVKPATPALPPVRYDGPALFAEARKPIEQHY
ncbi:nucleoside deaminase [Micromonospora zhanjiangensis]|uniref:Nucleoside deaminase n=1 Tax=Micromonospora zhanjiangensis TaxID=1522057 RepID=A0ABV8KW66_9ACTN